MSHRPVPGLSELSVTSFLTLSRIGFLPHGLVIGSSVYDGGSQYAWTVATQEVAPLSHAMRAARHLALQRMEQQAVKLNAEGVVGVRLLVEHHLWRGGRQVVKFVATGTAIGFDRGHAPDAFKNAPGLHLANGAPFSSDLSGQDFLGLLRAGYRPVTVAMGNCVYGLDPRELRRYRGQNAEIQSYTQAFFDARETAMGRLQHDLFSLWPPGHPDAPTGIVGMTVSETTYGAQSVQGPPIVEFTAIGTAVAPLHPSDPRRASAPPRPVVVVPLDG